MNISKLGKEYKKMFKDVPHKDDKEIRETTEKEKFYRVVGGIFYVPPIEYMKANLKELRTLNELFNLYYEAENNVDTISEWDIANWNIPQLDTEEQILNFIEMLKSQQEIAIDLETTGFSYFDNEIILYIFAWGHNDVGAFSLMTDNIKHKLEELFALETISFIWQNGKFDKARFLSYHGLDPRIDEDTMLRHYIGFNENRGTHGLGQMAQLYLDAPDWEKDLDIIKKRVCKDEKLKLADFNYGMFPREDLVKYGCFDGIATFRLNALFKKLMDPKYDFIYYKLVEAANEFAYIELKGVVADIDTINELDEVLGKEVIEIEQEIFDITIGVWDSFRYMNDTGAKTAPEHFNPASPKQVKWIFAQYGVNMESTNEEALSKIELPLAKAILRLRKNNKYRKTYVRGLKNSIDSDGRIHTSYNLHGTVTGRISSSDPNLQNIPRDKLIKNIFRSTEGYIWTQADYSQAELRVLAVLSDDPWLKDVYIKGDDLHTRVAIEYWGENFTSEDRVKAKAVNFGIAYGRTEYTLAPGLNISIAEARKLLVDWFVPMPNVKRFFDDRVKHALRGEPSFTPFNRRREFIVTDTNKFSIRNEAMNTPIQGTASDLTIFSIIEIQKELRQRNLGSIVLTVHDSIIVEHLPEHAEEVAELMKRHMESVPGIYLNTDVPFVADIDNGVRWGEID